MNLQTQIPLKKQNRNLINHQSNIFLLGSCFSDNIGDKLDYHKFKTVQNPFGILFHPIAIENLIEAAINNKTFSNKDLIYQNERWHCFYAHSSLSSTTEKLLLNKLNSAVSITNKKLKEATHITITLGTSWVYRFIESDKIIANCHKIPQKKFLKELLSVDEITETLDSILALIKSVNKDAKVIFTVSPVRHLKDGFVENMQSKAHLIAAIHNIVDERKNIHYFPSYEIMMDELRDYRFYADDMIHPNKTAIKYIWEKFVYNWVSEESLAIMEEIETIQKGIAHKPFNENSEQHQKFLSNLELKKEKITQQFNYINF